jgi:hypothetical protein
MTLEGSTYTGTLVQAYRMANCFWRGVTLKGTSTDAGTTNILGNGRGYDGHTLWNCHFTDCYFTGLGAGPTQTPGSLPAVTVTDDGVANSGSNSVHFTACEFEGNYYDDLFVDGPTQVAAGVLVTGGKHERGNACAVRIQGVNGISVTGNYFYQDINVPAVIQLNSANAQQVSICANDFSGQSTSLPTYMVQFVTGNFVTFVGNTFLGGVNNVRLESGFGTATIMGNTSNTFGTPATVNDARTVKNGIIQMSNGRIHFYDGIGTKVKAGTPVNGDFQFAPPAGTIVYDSTASKLWVSHDGTTWKGVLVT